MNRSFALTEEETALVADGEFFRKKAAISEKVRRMLEATYVTLKGEVGHCTIVAPPDFDMALYQFVRGEHLEEFPYQYLDYPKYFRRAEKCTFRTLFWWGHHAVFAWILEGGAVKQYKKNLVDRFHAIAGRDLELSTAPTLWEWKCGEGYTLPLTHDRKATMAAVLSERSFIKIARFIPLTDPRVRAGDLAELARAAFQAMKPIVSA